MVINDKKNRLLGVWVKDQDKTLDFYLEKLGFEKQTDIEWIMIYRWLELSRQELKLPSPLLNLI
jgi:catechol 2,3-dioxygenase-like lactoylglutathione lyase family enzyme